MISRMKMVFSYFTALFTKKGATQGILAALSRSFLFLAYALIPSNEKHLTLLTT